MKHFIISREKYYKKIWKLDTTRWHINNAILMQGV